MGLGSAAGHPLAKAGQHHLAGHCPLPSAAPIWQPTFGWFIRHRPDIMPELGHSKSLFRQPPSFSSSLSLSLSARIQILMAELISTSRCFSRWSSPKYPSWQAPAGGCWRYVLVPLSCFVLLVAMYCLWFRFACFAGSSSMPFSSRLPSRAPGFEQGVLPAGGWSALFLTFFLLLSCGRVWWFSVFCSQAANS